MVDTLLWVLLPEWDAALAGVLFCIPFAIVAGAIYGLYQLYFWVKYNLDLVVLGGMLGTAALVCYAILGNLGRLVDKIWVQYVMAMPLQ